MTSYETTETSRSFRIPRVVRSIAAMVAGLAAVAIPSIAVDALLHNTGVYPPLDQPQPAYTLAIALAYRTVFTVIGGYVAAWIAGYRPVTHGIVLGAIGVVLGTLGAVTMWHIGNQWYPIALVALAIPSTWLGSRLFARR